MLGWLARVRSRVRTTFERRSGDQNRVDGFCDFEKVPPDQLLGIATGLGLLARVSLAL